MANPDPATWFAAHIDLAVTGVEDRMRMHAVLDELMLLRSMRDALDRAAAENEAGDPTELARRVIHQIQSQSYSIVYALAKQVIRDHQHTLKLSAEVKELRAWKESREAADVEAKERA